MNFENTKHIDGVKEKTTLSERFVSVLALTSVDKHSTTAQFLKCHELL